ncbi:hypothetical protein [Arenimonas composti]|uniref:Phytase-like domain-containing protein n=1 Tax=Arenimonas composti TR7-09 = DSM 18010 TaxID=1121013 RepID=A0A091BG02_9GAMM|nr:hypothetical protein [Arenimonas composti]KFN49739.1 hypothetical protein P873_09280 [Arenimonas composti TR7-09 = DSM 18010]
MRPSTLFLLASLLVAAPAEAMHWRGAEPAGLLTDPRIGELSGLAASRRHPGRFWALNDSGASATLHLLDPDGSHRGSAELADTRNIDWEDLASFRLDGRDYLLIADTGDNGGLRAEVRLHVLEEPDAGETAPVAWTLRFRWPDGPRDCEAVTVDPERGEVLLITKKRVPAELYRLPLRPPAGSPDVLVAERLGRLQGIQQPTAEDLRRSPTWGRYRAQITGAALSPNGRLLAVLNYRALYFVVRPEDGDWADALARPLPSLPLPFTPQAEAVAFSLDGRALLVGSEQLPSPLWWFRIVD